MSSLKTLVVGASVNPNRYSYKAVTMLHNFEHEVVALGLRKGEIGDIDIITEIPDVMDIHTITLYLNPKRQVEMYDDLLKLEPVRIIFNPGTENRELAELANKQGIETVEACTLVMLSTGQYDLTSLAKEDFF